MTDEEWTFRQLQGWKQLKPCPEAIERYQLVDGVHPVLYVHRGTPSNGDRWSWYVFGENWGWICGGYEDTCSQAMDAVMGAERNVA